MSSIPRVQEPTSLKKLLDNSSATDYTQSAEELRQLIVAMQAEFKTLRESKAQAEATADKLRTDFSLHQEETEAQLISLSSENERLRSTKTKVQILQVELNQCKEKCKKIEKDNVALRERLVGFQNEKLSLENKLMVLEAVNAALHKSVNDFSLGVIPEEVMENIETSGYARSA